VAALQQFHRSEAMFRGLTCGAACLVLLIFSGIVLALGTGAWPALHRFGLPFLTATAWNPVTERFGALPAIYGTIVTSALAMFVAVPVGIGTAIFLTELCPRPARRPVGIAIELLAGIPSIIYGIWGLFVFAPFFQQKIQPGIIEALSGLPFVSNVFAGPPYGIGVFTASLILSIMILPFISAVTRDVFETVPPMLKEAAYGLGCTTWEVTWNVVLPYARSGVVGGAMLGLGRALGETMAVTFVIGNAHKISSSLFAPGTTISATIANEFTEALGDLYVSSLIAIGLILFFITFLVLAAAQWMLRSLEARSGGRSQ
jgi:phosphate transport system permease protein